MSVVFTQAEDKFAYCMTVLLMIMVNFSQSSP